jgi:hypothetical protein
MAYQHRQRGTLVLTTMGIAAVMIVVLFAVADDLPLAAAIVPAVVIALLMLNFGSLSTHIEGQNLHIALGIGWIRRSIPLSTVTAAEVTQTRWFYGWGIRLTPKGWLWNTSGFNAVQLTYDNGKHFLIGSDDADGLATAIEKVIGD